MKQILPKYKPLYLAIMLLLISTASWAQQRTISGTVTNSQTNETLPGASVIIKGTTK